MRIKRKLHQQGLADITKINRVMISTYERGEIRPDLKNLVILSKALRVSTDYLLGLK
jgi:transcriptional regulator with XRE-family HTH domain